MKKNFKIFSILMLSLLSTAALAADGQIIFTGELIDTGCTITNSMANPLSVDLGKVSVGAFKNKGDVASPTKFTIQLTGCPDTVKTAKVKFDGTSDLNVNTVLALDSTSIGEGVGIQISDQHDKIIELHTASDNYELTTGNNNLDFIARYYANGVDAKPGKVTSTTNFTIVYN